MSTEWAFWALLVALGIYEAVTLGWTTAPDDHITAIVRRVSRRPVVPFLGGMLAGHLWWCG